MKSPADSSVIVCGIVRNAAAGLKRNIPAIKYICSFFKDYQIVIFENDSTDNTKELLTSWRSSCPVHVVCIMENIDSSSTIPKLGTVPGNPFFSESRIAKMARFRNRYLEYLEEQKLVADYLMVVDLDVEKIFPDTVLSCFKDNPDWDAVTAFGYSISPNLRRRYHDTYIFQEWEHRGEPQTQAYMSEMATKYASLKPSDPWVRVAAAFGGLAFYRFEAVRGLRYKVLLNNDAHVTVYGEHYSLYVQMMDRGYDRFYLNPSLCLKYQKVTPGIVWRSLKRRLGL